jgi:hypothetical protein
MLTEAMKLAVPPEVGDGGIGGVTSGADWYMTALKRLPATTNWSSGRLWVATTVRMSP